METAKELKEDSFSIKLSVYDFNQLLISGKKLKLVITDGNRAVHREVLVEVKENENLDVISDEERSKIIQVLMGGGYHIEAERASNRDSAIVDKVMKEFYEGNK